MSRSTSRFGSSDLRLPPISPSLTKGRAIGRRRWRAADTLRSKNQPRSTVTVLIDIIAATMKRHQRWSFRRTPPDLLR